MPLVMVIVLALTAQSPTGPMVLSRGDIGDNYYDAPPAEIVERTSWLGLFVNEGKSGQPTDASRVAVTRVTFALLKERESTVYRLVTTPPGAELLVSGVPQLSPGSAITVSQDIDLGGDKREAELRLGRRRYSLRLNSRDPNYCDAVITLTESGRRQTLFDAAAPATTSDPALVLSCDGPHFKVHWAGDADRDGHLDLLVTFSKKYSYHPRQLLLSSGARPGGLVAQAARYDKVE